MPSTTTDNTSSFSSMDSVLQSREADPEEVLINLGFAESEALAKIPLRFFKQPSKVITKLLEYVFFSVILSQGQRSFNRKLQKVPGRDIRKI